MKVLLLGVRENYDSLYAVQKLLELERMGPEILLFEGCTEKSLVQGLKSSDMYVFCPDSLPESPEGAGEIFSLKLITAGFLIARTGRCLVYSKNGSGGEILAGEPSASSIGEILAFFRREKKAREGRRALVLARKIISEAELSFSNTGFVQAVEYGMYKETQAFLKAGFSADTENSEGVSLISLAVRNSDIDIIRLLMSYNASLNTIARDRRSNPLIDAVSSDDIEVADMLIKSGVDLNFRNRNGQTALIVAIGARMKETAELLIESGADVTVKDSLGMTALQYAKLFGMSDLYSRLEA